MSVPVKLVRVKANGRRFIYINEAKGKVHCKGEVMRVSGYSAMHGPDRVFLADRVEVTEVDLSEELLNELHRESTLVVDRPKPEAPITVLPEEDLSPSKRVNRKLANLRDMQAPRRKHWLKRTKDWDGYNHLELTRHAKSQLFKEGKSMAEDGLGNYLDERTMGDAAMDAAAYHYELTADGAKEGYSTLREIAAEYIHDGMQAALEQAKKEGRKTTLEAV